MSVADRVTSVVTTCFGRLLSDIHPADRGRPHGDPEKRCRLTVVSLNDPGYRPAFERDYNPKGDKEQAKAALAKVVDPRYVTEAELAVINELVFGVKPDWAEFIEDSSMSIGMLVKDREAASNAAGEMYAALQQILDQGDEPTYLNIEDLLADHSKYAPEPVE